MDGWLLIATVSDMEATFPEACLSTKNCRVVGGCPKRYAGLLGKKGRT
jgi:hypothetical protein